MDVREAIYGRRAVRSFCAEPVDRDLLTSLIDAAVQAPSAMNEQPWAFSVVQDRALLERISGEAKILLLINPPTGIAPERLRGMLADERFHVLYQAPALIVIWGTAEKQSSIIDCTLAAQNLMLRAHELGLGTCWIGLAQTWLESADGRLALGVPNGWHPVAPIIVGHPLGSAASPQRKAPEISWFD